MTQLKDQHGGEPNKDSGPVTPPRRTIYKDLVLLQLFATVFLIDQLTKFLVREFVELRDSVPAEGFFRITHTFNTGSAFGLFRDQNLPLIVVSVVGIGILILIYRSQARPGKLLRLSLGMQLGGAAGNLLDRLRFGHVTDFADVGSWPIFNVADASIVIGLALLAWIFLISDESKSGAKKAAPDLKKSESETPEPLPIEAEPGIPNKIPDSKLGIQTQSEASSQPSVSNESRESGEPAGGE